MDSVSSYPSIFALGHRALGEGFLDRDLIVQEKYDGSQFSAAWTGERWIYRSKGGPGSQGRRARSLSAYYRPLRASGWNLGPWIRIQGRAFKKAQHNTLRYGRIPEGHLVLFDVEAPGQHFAFPEQVAQYASIFGLEPARTLHVGKVTVEQIQEWLKEESSLGGTRIEGVVLKPANYDLFGEDKKLLIAKVVREEFKELNGAAWKISNPSRADVVQALIARYRAEPRWRKAVQHLRDAGKLDGSPKDIGPLMAEVKRDIEKEEKESIAEALVARFMPDIVRGATGGLPDWYKAELSGVKQ